LPSDQDQLVDSDFEDHEVVKREDTTAKRGWKKILFFIVK
jgi:hypothetical protein